MEANKLPADMIADVEELSRSMSDLECLADVMQKTADVAMTQPEGFKDAALHIIGTYSEKIYQDLEDLDCLAAHILSMAYEDQVEGAKKPDPEEPDQICSICGKPIRGKGNDPWPIKPDASDRCCDICNMLVVVPARRRLGERAKRKREEARNGRKEDHTEGYGEQTADSEEAVRSAAADTGGAADRQPEI